MCTRLCPWWPPADESAAFSSLDAPRAPRRISAFFYPRILGAILAATLPGVPAANGAARLSATEDFSRGAPQACERDGRVVTEDGAKEAIHATAA